jgi:hypothetical protein
MLGEDLIKLVFTESDREDMKEKLKEIIIDAFREDINAHLDNNYLIDYEEFFENIIEEAKSDVEGKLKSMLVDKMMAEATKKLGITNE